jgi:hypothetical protein
MQAIGSKEKERERAIKRGRGGLGGVATGEGERKDRGFTHGPKCVNYMYSMRANGWVDKRACVSTRAEVCAAHLQAEVRGDVLRCLRYWVTECTCSALIINSD